MTDEQFVAYLDAAQERISDAFATAVEAARMGAIFGSPGGDKSYRRWRSRADREAGKPSSALAGAALESAIMGLAARHPEYVVVGK